MEKVKWTYWLHLLIGLGFMFVFPQLSPIEPITKVGMAVLGVFIGMIYLWSTVDSIWPSLVGLLVVGIAGYVPELSGYAAVKNLMLNAFGDETVLVTLFALVLFGGISYVGCTAYMTRFFLSIKLLEGRPYIFLFIFFLCSNVVAGCTNPLAALLVLWPIAIDICSDFGYKKGDKIFYVIVCGTYFAATLGQPMLPIKSAQYILISAFEQTSGIAVNKLNYIVFNIVMSLILLTVYIIFVKLIIKPNVEGFKNITVEELNKEKLPKMNMQQKAFFIVIPAYVAGVLLPQFLPKSWGITQFLINVGLLGINILCIVILMIIPYKGKPLMDFRGIAKKSFSWDTFFLVAAAIYICGAMTAESTGIKPFLISILQPLLGNRSDFAFVAIIISFAVLTTNVGNNAGMGIVLIPIVLVFTEQYSGVNATALCMCVVMSVFLALLTPAASPYCGMMHARKDLVSTKELMSLFVPMTVIGIVIYFIIGYPIANMLF